MASLMAGAATTDITPSLGASIAGYFHDRKAEDVDDPLHAKAVVLDNGECRIAMVVLDLLGISGEYVKAIRDLVTESTGIPGENVLVACTHTHTGPTIQDIYDCKHDEDYIKWMIRRAADAVSLAVRRLQPARIAWDEGEQPDPLFCRRFRMRDGSVKMNPGRGNPDAIAPTSPIDPVVGVLYIEDAQRQPLAVIARYSLHYVGTDNNNAISADYYAHFADVMGRVLGAGCTTLLFNGTSGQINNVDVQGPAPQQSGAKQARKVAIALAGEVLKVIGRMRLVDSCVLGSASEKIKLPRMKITAEDVEAAKQILETGQAPSDKPFSWVTGPISGPILKICAEDAPILAAMPPELPSEVQVLRIGDSAWVGLPGEIFTEIGIAIRAGSPTPHTFAVELANDNRGYIPTDHALLHEGGYETFANRWSPLGPGTEGVLRETALRLLEQLFEA
jgi:neutral ceramidase